MKKEETLILASDGPMTSVKKLYSRNHGGMKRVSTFVNYQLVKNYMLNVKTIYIYIHDSNKNSNFVNKNSYFFVDFTFCSF